MTGTKTTPRPERQGDHREQGQPAGQAVGEFHQRVD